jgi:hypothetical protein
MSTENISLTNDQKYICRFGNRGASCSAPGCICVQYGSDETECDCRCIKNIYKPRFINKIRNENVSLIADKKTMKK